MTNEQELELVKMYSEGTKKVYEITDVFSCSTRTVYEVLRKHGIPIGLRPFGRRMTPQQKIKIQAAHLNGNSIKSIAKWSGFSRRTVSRVVNATYR